MTDWTSRFYKVFPLDTDELEEILDHAQGLPSDDAASAFLSGLLEDTPASHALIADFVKSRHGTSKEHTDDAPPPVYAATAPAPTAPTGLLSGTPSHANDLIRASDVRARDEQDMQQQLQLIQFKLRIWNAEIEPEHDTEYYCNCVVHQYQRRKMARVGVQKMWCKAVMYPGERFYSNVLSANSMVPLLNGNPYIAACGSPFGFYNNFAPIGIVAKAQPDAHLQWTRKTIALNNRLNGTSQARVDKLEPADSIWGPGDTVRAPGEASASTPAKSRLGRFTRSLGIRSVAEKATEFAASLRASILNEEAGRWPDRAQRQLVARYQDKVGMARHIAELRARKPLQYLHLLRAGYFEPMPAAWASQASNPLTFAVEAREGWRGITPAWRGYEDLAEERLYWVLNHRDGSARVRMKPDVVWEMDMAQKRMAAAVEPPPVYFAADDTCMQQHTTADAHYSKQVMPLPLSASDAPAQPTDDSMILLDVSGSMDFAAVRPVYEHYLVTRYVASTQPKNKDVAKAVLRRFTDALGRHDHQTAGYDLVTFSDRATHVGAISHRDFDALWADGVRVGGGTRVMAGWQKVKALHFAKHRATAVHDAVYGWQAGPATPVLRLLLLLDGEAQDMDAFELDLLGLSWAHVTIFLIGVDNCPHHHRHANELQRISDVNAHVSFVDAQGNCPERFVTHELLKRHLGYDVSMAEFVAMETPPEYSA